MKLLQTIKHELKQVGFVTLYFLVAFGLILVMMKLFLASYNVEIYVISKVVLGALIVGKVLIILDKTRFGNRYSKRAPALNVLYKSVIYTLFVLLVAIIEKVYHLHHETHSVGESLRLLYEGRDSNKIWASILIIGLSFVVYNVFAEINKHVNLRNFFFNSRNAALKETDK